MYITLTDYQEWTNEVSSGYAARTDIFHDRYFCVSLSSIIVLSIELQESQEFFLDMRLLWGRQSEDNTYDVTMDDAAIIGGPFGYPVEMESRFKLQLL